MDLRQVPATGRALVKTKIVATLGPACESPDVLRELIATGVDVFRVNLAHGTMEWRDEMVRKVRAVSEELGRPVGLLGDLAGPKIRLGTLPDDGLTFEAGEIVRFARQSVPNNPRVLTCTYEALIDDLQADNRVLMADGAVAMRVTEKDSDGNWVDCEVVQGGTVFTRQGVNLPGVALSTPSVTDKDREDLAWALEVGLDFVSLSFVRRAADIELLRSLIAERNLEHPPLIVAKIEKVEAIAELEQILEESDAVMVARGDLGVEADISRVPMLQKQIIRMCNERRIPVITATQMLDSMQKNELPTRAEASDVANAVLDGSDAVMLSGETAVGKYPVKAVRMMGRICREAEAELIPRPLADAKTAPRSRAAQITEATTAGAGAAAEELKADLLVVATRTGKTAMALSKQRRRVPILALTDSPQTARQMCLFWGVTPMQTPAVCFLPDKFLDWVVQEMQSQQMLFSGDKLVLVGNSRWQQRAHDLMLVHVLP